MRLLILILASAAFAQPRFFPDDPLDREPAPRNVDKVLSRKLIISVAYLTSILLIPAALVTDKVPSIALLAGASLVGLSTANIFALVQRITRGGEL